MSERITVRRLDPWSNYKSKHCSCKDASSYNRCEGLPTCTLRADHPERKTPAPEVKRRRHGVPSIIYIAFVVQSLCMIALALTNLGAFK